jgi:hypothetical protein
MAELGHFPLEDLALPGHPRGGVIGENLPLESKQPGAGIEAVPYGPKER